MRIDYKHIDLPKEKDVSSVEAFVELTDNLLYWKSKYYCDIPIIHDDEASGWHNKMKCAESWVKKDCIVGIGKAYLFLENIWQIFIDGNGLAGSIEMYFKREKDADAFAEKIVNWMLNK